MSYREKADDGVAALSVDAQHSVTSLRSDRPFVTTWIRPERPAGGRRVLYRTRTAIDRIAADYDLPLATGWRLRSGGEWRREVTAIGNGAVSFDPAVSASLPVPALAQFDGMQRIAVLDGAVTWRKGDRSAEAGTRVEDIAITVAASPGVARVERRLGGFAHRLSVMRDRPRDHWALRLSRSRERLDPRDLSPIVVTVDPQRLSRGNPLLRPQDVTTAEVEYGIDRSGLRATATIFLRRTDRLIGEFYDIAGDGVLLRTAANAGTRRSAGAEVTVGGPIGKAVKYGLAASFRRDGIDTDDGFGRTRAALTGYSLQASIDWDATKRDKLHIDADRRGPDLLPQGRRSGTSGVNVVWRHTLSPRLTASLTARGLVQDSRVRTVIRTAVTTTDTDWVTDTRAVLFGLAVTR
ncbi:TonB-dependent receptor domain-containing protein [Sphingomonas floccifaciens]|uniref:TonB-dependent receptor domain-containing protein n=1 Tax=Sphingomonas floccifaciens TaxID=1844115 RepID=A0ABW4NEQ2_9SPHN